MLFNGKNNIIANSQCLNISKINTWYFIRRLLICDLGMGCQLCQKWFVICLYLEAMCFCWVWDAMFCRVKWSVSCHFVLSEFCVGELCVEFCAKQVIWLLIIFWEDNRFTLECLVAHIPRSVVKYLEPLCGCVGFDVDAFVCG